MDENKGIIEVSIISFDKGLISFDNVQAIRVHSKDYRLLIMSDHAPILGEIDGDIIVLQEDGEKKIEDVNGFFTHINNHFKFIQS